MRGARIGLDARRISAPNCLYRVGLSARPSLRVTYHSSAIELFLPRGIQGPWLTRPIAGDALFIEDGLHLRDPCELDFELLLLFQYLPAQRVVGGAEPLALGREPVKFGARRSLRHGRGI